MYYHSPHTYRNFITPNAFSRPGRNRKFNRGMVWHWVNNPKSSDLENRNYFENLKSQPGVKEPLYASANYIVGFKRITQAIPDQEESFHCGAKNYTELGKRLMEGCRSPNQALMGIELCHMSESGKPEEQTYKLAVSLGAEKATAWGWNPMTDFHLHGHIVLDEWDGRLNPRPCHKYYMDHPDEWEKFKEDVVKYQNTLKPQHVAEEEIWKHDAVLGMHKRELITSLDWAKAPNDPLPRWAQGVIINRLYDHTESRDHELQLQINAIRKHVGM